MASHLSILVTGSRTVIDGSLLCAALDTAVASRGGYSRVSLHVGDCPTGVDMKARLWWGARCWTGDTVLTSPDSMVEMFTGGDRARLYLYHADWAGEGRAAGPIRNSRMVKAWDEDDGHHHAIAQWDGSSRGTLDCLAKVVRSCRSVEVIPA